MPPRVQILPGQRRVVRAVAVAAERGVGVFHDAGAAGGAAVEEERVDVFPDDLASGSDLEHAARRALADQRVPVGLTLGAADVVTVEGDGGHSLVLPMDLVGSRIHLHDAGVTGAAPVGAVVEDQHPSVVQPGGMMLVVDFARAPLPLEGSSSAVGDAHSAGQTEAYQQVTVGRDVQAIPVGPFPPGIQRTENVFGRIQVLPGPPFPNGRAVRRHFANHVAKHPRGEIHIVAPLYLGYQILWDGIPHQQQGVAVGQALVVVMQRVVPVSPDQVAVPVQFDDAGGRTAHRLDTAGVLGR